MPLTAKGSEIKAALTTEYGTKKGEQVLYAGKNAGTFTGMDSAKDRIDAYHDSVRRSEDDAVNKHFPR